MVAEVRMAGEMGRQAVVRAALSGDAVLPSGALEDWPWESPTPKLGVGVPFASGSAVGTLDLFQCPSCGIWCTSMSASCPTHRSALRTRHRRGGLVGVGRD